MSSFLEKRTETRESRLCVAGFRRSHIGRHLDKASEDVAIHTDVRVDKVGQLLSSTSQDSRRPRNDPQPTGSRLTKSMST